jgi:hypothetical protein
MTKSQNTESEQQKDLCITSEQLTEQWKCGRLPSGYYYIIPVGSYNHYYIDYYNAETDDWEVNYCNKIQTVIDQVPSYDEWQLMQDDNKRLKHDVGNLGYKIKNQRHEIDNRLKEIKQLKELLKECKPYIALYTENNKRVGFTPETANLLQRIKEILQ